MFTVLSLSVFLGLVKCSQVVVENVNVMVSEVEVALNSVARLPCDLKPPTDDDVVTLVIWYHAGSESPIYSLDARGRPVDQASHWADEKTLDGRGYFRIIGRGEGRLTLDSVKESDEGSYKCRVDFRKSPTRNTLVNLTVIVPPKKVLILDENREPLSRPMVGPYSEGVTITLTCVSLGGSPLPHVTWSLEGVSIDETFETDEVNERVHNELLLEKLDRSHAGKVFKCHASSSDTVTSVTADVKVDMYLKVLDVRLIGENLPLSAGSEYEIACQSLGSRPSATITWWKAGQMMEHTRETTSPDGNVTVSTLTLSPQLDDVGKSLSCRASNPHVLGSAREDTWTLDVHYAPHVTLRLGSNINGSSIKEGVDVYFECFVKANPWMSRITWKHDGRSLHNNISSGIIISNQTLVLQSVSKKSSGLYTCVASNTEGYGESNPVHLDVKYEPICRSLQQRVYGAARGEPVTISCEVDGNPPANMFRWTFNNSAIRSQEVESITTEDGGRSVASYTPMSEQNYGTLLCWGRNELGPQTVPCIFHVVPAGKPDAPRNCSVVNKTQSTLFVVCSRGFDGGLPQQFTIEVFQSIRLVSNMTSRATPEFLVAGLEPGGTYTLNVYSSNLKGRSNAMVTVQVTTLRPTQQEHRRNVPTPVPTMSLLASIDPLLWIIAGVICSLSLLIILIIIVVRLKGGLCDNDEDDTHNSSSGAESGEDAGKLTVHLPKQPIQRITVDEGMELDERNPDVIPLTNDVEQTSTSDLAEVESNARSWKSSSDLNASQLNVSSDLLQTYLKSQESPASSVYETPAPLDKWTQNLAWQQTGQQSPRTQQQYNIILNKDNMVFMDPIQLAQAKQQSAIVLTTLSIDPSILTSTGVQTTNQRVGVLVQPSTNQTPGILLKPHPEALLATIPENKTFDRTKPLYHTLPSKVKQQHAETQTPLVVRHKESAV